MPMLRQIEYEAADLPSTGEIAALVDIVAGAYPELQPDDRERRFGFDRGFVAALEFVSYVQTTSEVTDHGLSFYVDSVASWHRENGGNARTTAKGLLVASICNGIGYTMGSPRWIYSSLCISPAGLRVKPRTAWQATLAAGRVPPPINNMSG